METLENKINFYKQKEKEYELKRETLIKDITITENDIKNISKELEEFFNSKTLDSEKSIELRIQELTQTITHLEENLEKNDFILNS